MIPFFKKYKNFIILFLLVFITLAYFLYKYNKILEKNHIDILVSNQIEIAQNEIINQKNQALSLAIIFSKNQTIIDNLENNNKIELKKELIKILDIIKIYTKQDIDIQVHTKNLEVFVRSWEDKDEGMPLSDFREGLVKAKKSLSPYVSNELGKRFNIKAIVPIYGKNSEFIGSIELIVDFKELINRLKSFGIEAIILLEKEYLQIASSYESMQTLEDFVVLQGEYNKEFFEILKNNRRFLEKNSPYYEYKNRVIASLPLGIYNNKSVGVLQICFDKNMKNFAYLPQYSYFGDINGRQNSKKSEDFIKKEIIIKW